MGAYTSLRFYAELKNLSQKEINAILWIGFLRDPKDYIALPNHPFFKENRADLIFTCSEGKLLQNPKFFAVHDIWILDTHAEIKNYEGEIELFLDWISPFVKRGLLSNGEYALTKYCEAKNPTLYFVEED